MLPHFAGFHNFLTEISSENKLVPDLAKSFTPGNRGKTWFFNLRRGVEFHNGKTLTAEDVIASFELHGGADSKSAVKSLVDQIRRMKADGKYRVAFELKDANADFPYICGDAHLPILPSKGGVITDPTAGIGTGGYILESYEPGVRATFRRNPNFFRDDAAWFDEYEVLSIIDITARQNAVLNGEVDHIDGVSPQTFKLLSRAPRLKTWEVTGSQHYTFPMRVTTPPFDNYDMRMALKYAVDREGMLKKILFGHGAVGNDLPFPPTIEYYNHTIPQRKFDPDKAAYHFRKSGFSGTIPLSSADSAFPGAVNAAQLYAASAKKCGINIKVIREPSDGYWTNVWNKKGFTACYWGGRSTQDWMFSAAYVAESEWNDTDWRTGESAERFNKLVVAARAETNHEKRRKLYFEAQELLHEDGGLVAPIFAPFIHATSKKVAIPKQVAANWENDGNHCSTRWWFK